MLAVLFAGTAWAAASGPNNAGNVSTGTMSDGITLDGTAPSVSVTAPASSHVFSGISTTITGVASSATSAIATVDVTVQRSSDSLYWTGVVWQALPYYLPASYSAGDWSYDWTFEPVRQQGSPTYTIQATATDDASDSGISDAVTEVSVHNQFTIAASADTGGSISPSGSVDVNYGADQSFAIDPDTGYHVADVLVDGVSVGAVTSYEFKNITETHTIAASFAINTYTLTYSAGPHGSITGSSPQTVAWDADGSEVTATPAEGYHLVEWSDGVKTASRTDLAVAGNITVTASFAINRYTLTYAAGPGGSLDGATSQVVVHGASGTTVTAVPAPNYHFLQWSDGVTTNPRVDANVMTDVTVTALFLNHDALMEGIRRYLLGLGPAAVGYDRNRDGRIDAADLLWAIQEPR